MAPRLPAVASGARTAQFRLRLHRCGAERARRGRSARPAPRAHREAIVNTPLAEAASGEAGDAGTAARVFALQSGLRDVERRLTRMPTHDGSRRARGRSAALAGRIAGGRRGSARGGDGCARLLTRWLRRRKRRARPARSNKRTQRWRRCCRTIPMSRRLAPLARTGAPTRDRIARPLRAARQRNHPRRAAKRRLARVSGAASRRRWRNGSWCAAPATATRPKASSNAPNSALRADQSRRAIARTEPACPKRAKRVAQPWIDDATRRLEIDTRLAAIRTELSRGS